MENRGKAEYLIQESGCGTFQILMVFLVYGIIKIPTSFTMMFMAFGNYNPGWRCLDNITSNSYNNNTGLVNELGSVASNDNQTSEYTKGTCDLFDSCGHVEFDPETSTIVTEWNLLCDKSWIPSLIISIQMAGILVGSCISGQLGDSFGRKITLYGALALAGVLNIVSMFSQSWQMFAVFRFFVGVMLSSMLSLYYILPSESIPTAWRGRITAIPFWQLGGILFAIVAMFCRDWKQIHVISGIACLASCLPAIWVPESLRWLEVNDKMNQFNRVAKKMASMSKHRVSLESYENNALTRQECLQKQENNTKKYNILDIFRRGYGIYTAILGFLWMSSSMIYYAISFGVKAMYGDFYINLIIIFAIEIPFSIIPIILPNILGRKISSMLFLGLTAACLLVATAFEVWLSGSVQNTGTLILAFLAKTSINAGWYTIVTLSAEIYPTTVRSIGNGFVQFMARSGGILAPFLIPNDSESIYICYLIMGILSIICCLLLIKLPETKEKQLQETFDAN